MLTGAGVSAESGVPTFREAQTGLWAKYDPLELATPEAFAREIESGTATVIGAEDADGTLIGVVVATHDGRKGWINRLATDPDRPINLLYNLS